MSQEHGAPERGREVDNDLESEAQERLSELRENMAERDPADHADRRAEQAREVINRQDVREQPAPDTETETPAPAHKTHVLNHHLNYAQTMAHLRRRLKPANRAFSQVIHTPIIEVTSEALEQTVARPSVLAGTVWTALIVGGIFYLTARYFGYDLSGSELLFSFIVGGLIGIVGEGVVRAIRR